MLSLSISMTITMALLLQYDITRMLQSAPVFPAFENLFTSKTRPNNDKKLNSPTGLAFCMHKIVSTILSRVC